MVAAVQTQPASVSFPLVTRWRAGSILTAAMPTVVDTTKTNKQLTVSSNLKKFFSLILNLKLQQLHQTNMTENTTISRTIVKLTNNLNNSLKRLPKNLNSPKVAYCYNPTEYAVTPYTEYLTKYCNDTKDVLFVGMDHGPFGMCQTGVPFGEENLVKNWLEISGEITPPTDECPIQPVELYSCIKYKENRLRFWSFFKEVCNKPQNFFKNAFVFNYFPLTFFDEKGYYLTHESICKSTLDDLEEMCDEMLINVIDLLKPKILVGVGRYAEKRCNIIKRKNYLDVRVIYMVHPRAGGKTYWNYEAEDFLNKNDLMHFFNTNN